MEEPSPRPSAPRSRLLIPTRLPLVARKRLEREAARLRIASRGGVPLTAAQRERDPLAAPRSRAGRGGKALAALLGSAAVHALVVLLGVVIGTGETGRRELIRQEVEVEMRDRPPEPPPPEPPPPEPPPEPPVRPPPRRVVEAEPPPPPPVEPPPSAPPRVVGLSLEATTEGGGGPSFAVGNTREGKTAERAAPPAEVPAEAPAAEPTPAAPANRAASRIPTAGVKYQIPKRRSQRPPPYPETLKSQGIEADVLVMVSLDASGKVTSVKVVKEAPYPEFNEAARAAALAEEYEPATRDGAPIPYTFSFTYRFRLEEE